MGRACFPLPMFINILKGVPLRRGGNLPKSRLKNAQRKLPNQGADPVGLRRLDA